MPVLKETGLELSTIGRAFDARFFPRFNTGGLPPWFTQVCWPNLESDQADETYAWLGVAPAMREFSRAIPITRPGSEKFTIVNQNFGIGIEATYEELRRQKFGMFDGVIAQMAARAQLWPLRRFYSELLGSSVGYDGKALFADDHPVGAGTGDNNIDHNVSTTTDPTAAELVGAVMAAIQNIRSRVDDSGEPIAEEITEFKVFVPPTFLKAAMEAFGAPVIASGSTAISNVITMGGTGMRITFEASPRLSSWTTKLAVIGMGLGMGAFIYQQEKPVGTAIIDDEINRRVIYTVDAAGAVKPGYWQLACLVTLI